MFAPAIEMAHTHADQLRRDALTWRERRQARKARAEGVRDAHLD